MTSWASNTELSALVSSSLLTTDLDAILNIAKLDIEAALGTVSTVTDSIKTAHLYKAAALLLVRLKTNGELAYMVRVGDSQQYNEIDEAIQFFEEKVKKILTNYGLASSTSDVLYVRTKPYFRADDDEDDYSLSR